MRIPLFLAAVTAVAAALAIPAWSASPPPQLTSFSASTVHKSSTGLKLAVSGSIDCTAKAHYHMWLWVYQSSRGALAHALLPKPTAKHRKRAKPRVKTCTGAAQPWKAKLTAEGMHAIHFAAGAAQVCASISVSHARRYAFQQTCASVTIG